MGIDVLAEKTAEGWVLQTADNARDVLAGPYSTEKETREAAKELDLTIRNPMKVLRTARMKTAGDLEPNALFSANGLWYRVIRREGSTVHVRIVGGDSVAKLPASTEITEISVLSRA